MKHNANAMAVCPFYKYEERHQIVCEGVQERMMKMPDTRDLNLEKYGISKWLYRELRAFCLQYDEKRRRLDFGVNDQKKAQTLLADVEAVEQATKAAGGEHHKALLYGETHDVRYFYLSTRKGLSCSERDYRRMRRCFYAELAKNLKKI